ncbi:MAG: hypothetical protein GY765_31365 [bacterium]|nr:hypothetical protein [bacterium]
MKKTIILVFFLTLILTSFSSAQEISLDKVSFAGGDEIRAIFKAPAEYVETAWVGIVPTDTPHGNAGTNAANRVTYLYLNKSVSGILVFKAPDANGAFDLRMHDAEGGKEVASISFTVEERLLTLDRLEFDPKEEIRIHFQAKPGFSADATIVIIPSHIPHGSETENDKYDITYQYLNKKMSGTLTFKAPMKSGSFDFRMHDTDKGGKEIASITFTVKGEKTETKGLDKF